MGIQISNSNSSFEGSEEPVEVDPSESDSNIKQEMWMMGTNEGEEGDEEEGEFVIPPEQYEQDMQAEDEQYIQAGTEGLSGQQFLAPTKQHLNAHGNRNVGYKQAAFVAAYYSVLTEGLTVTKAAFNHQIPRKTLEYYVKGKATLESYQKMGLPHPDEVLSSFGGSRGESEPALTESSS